MADPSVTISEEFLVSKLDTNCTANQIEQIQVHHPAVKKEDNYKVRILASKIQSSIGHLAPDREADSVCCIYKVPKKLRDGNEIHYAPRVVSIGPFHYGDPKYALMENVKLKILDIMIKDSDEPLTYFLEYIRTHEHNVRACYSEDVVELADSNNFVQMMLVDAAFIIKFIDTIAINGFDYDAGGDEAASLFLSRSNVEDIKHDLRLLENQLPLFFLEVVKRLFFTTDKKYDQTPGLYLMSVKDIATNIWHLPPHMMHMLFRDKTLHFLDLLRSLYLPTNYTSLREKPACELTPKTIKSAKKLLEAGVKVRAEKDMFKEYATFKKGGKLKISPLEIDETSETTYRNIMAFEQCHYPNELHVCDYIILLEMLIRDGSEEMLITNGVIVNKLSTSDQTMTTLLCELCKNVKDSSYPFRLGFLCESVNRYCDRPASKLKAAFNSTTWQVGATLIFLFTFLQTIFAAYAFFQSWKVAGH